MYFTHFLQQYVYIRQEAANTELSGQVAVLQEKVGKLKVVTFELYYSRLTPTCIS